MLDASDFGTFQTSLWLWRLARLFGPAEVGRHVTPTEVSQIWEQSWCSHAGSAHVILPISKIRESLCRGH